MVVDTSVLVAGIAGFRRPYAAGRNDSADFLHRWAAENYFVWLTTENILDEYKEVLARLGVRAHRIGRVINLVRERGEGVPVQSSVRISPDPQDDAFCICAEEGRADFIVTLNPKDFPSARLKAKPVPPGPTFRGFG